jgi:hypothetical protein
MSGYLAALTCLALVLSPLFIPIVVTVVHWARGGHRTTHRNTLPARVPPRVQGPHVARQTVAVDQNPMTGGRRYARD